MLRFRSSARFHSVSTSFSSSSCSSCSSCSFSSSSSSTVYMSIHSEGKSCSELGRVLVLNVPTTGPDVRRVHRRVHPVRVRLLRQHQGEAVLGGSINTRAESAYGFSA